MIIYLLFASTTITTDSSNDEQNTQHRAICYLCSNGFNYSNKTIVLYVRHFIAGVTTSSQDKDNNTASQLSKLSYQEGGHCESVILNKYGNYNNVSANKGIIQST